VIYLLSQIGISLVLAAIVGGAIGWLVHRARAVRHIHELQDIVDRQQLLVSEAQTEVNILTADFDDLKQISESEIATLKKDNKQIPVLNQNLEKSQLLVRQLMEKHKTELDETVEENEKLLVKSRQVDDREREISRLQAELDIERRKLARSDANNMGVTTASTPTPAEQQSSGDSSSDNSISDTSTTPLHNNDSSVTSGNSTSGTNQHSIKLSDDVSHTAINTPTPDNVPPARLPLSGNNVSGNNVSENIINTSDDTSVDETYDSNDDTLPNTEQTQTELAELRDQLAEDAPTGNNYGENSGSFDRESNNNFVDVNSDLTGPHALAETEVDESHLEQMFDTVEQHDDLKQIFGIGPVTEKTLNKLGITAYSQLAELKQHDIEKIANALQIFPGRIERDNWVGGARAQLEEVLEDL